jgi:ATP-dependent Clp protease ATP-binding subunit ClpA
MQGRTVDFRSTIIIMTSNLGSDIMYEMEEVSFINFKLSYFNYF